LSTATQNPPANQKQTATETPAEEPRRITHPEDSRALKNYGAKIEEEAIIAEYFEYRETFGLGWGEAPGAMPLGTLLELAVRQKRRLAKAAKAATKTDANTNPKS
jgi:hypothetical protein